MGIRVFAIASFAALLVAGCSKGTPADHPDGDITDRPDAHQNADAADHVDAPEVADAPIVPDALPGTPDARPPDAAGPPDAASPPDAHVPVAITLSQNIDGTTITAGNSVSCNNGLDNAENSYYRAYSLPEHGVVGPLTISSVAFAVEQATAGVGTTQPGTLKLYSYTGAFGGTTLDTAAMTPLATSNITITNTTNTILSFPMSAVIPANGAVVLELLIPDGTVAGTGDLLFIGSNAAGQTRPSYLRAPDCGFAIPTSLATIGFPDQHQIMTVTGTYTP